MHPKALNSSSQFQWLHRTNGVAQSGRLSRAHIFLGVPHHAKMRRCGGSRWDTATHLLLEQLNSHKNSTAAGETPALANCSPSMFFVWPSFTTSHDRTSFTTFRENYTSMLCILYLAMFFEILLFGGAGCYGRARFSPSPGLEESPRHATALSPLIMNDGTGLGRNVLPRNQWLLTVVHHFPTFSPLKIAMLGYSQISDTPM